jgi:hypothetical protein
VFLHYGSDRLARGKSWYRLAEENGWTPIRINQGRRVKRAALFAAPAQGVASNDYGLDVKTRAAAEHDGARRLGARGGKEAAPHNAKQARDIKEQVGGRRELAGRFRRRFDGQNAKDSNCARRKTRRVRMNVVESRISSRSVKKCEIMAERTEAPPRVPAAARASWHRNPRAAGSKDSRDGATPDPTRGARTLTNDGRSASEKKRGATWHTRHQNRRLRPLARCATEQRATQKMARSPAASKGFRSRVVNGYVRSGCKDETRADMACGYRGHVRAARRILC